MTTYARVKSGFVIHTFTPLPEWEHLDPADLFHPDLTDEWVVIDGMDPPPAYGWSYADGTFTPPDSSPEGLAPVARAMRRMTPKKPLGQS
jgi:hypothetical protein